MIRIVTDSASDIDMKAAGELGIICIPLTVSFGREEFKENIELSKTEFYKRLMTDKESPQTSQVPPYAFEQVFREAKEAGDDIIAILLSSRLSGTYQSARIAKESVYDSEGISNGDGSGKSSCYVIDSRSASAGQQLLAEYAAKLREEGSTAREIVKQLRALRSRIQLYACVNTLEYLYRGGRISRAAATIGTMIHIKPILYVNEYGEVELAARVRGNQKAVTNILERIKKEPPDERYPIYIMYSYADEGARHLRKAVRMAGYQVRMKHVIHVGAVIGSHVGPYAYGVVYVRK